VNRTYLRIGDTVRVLHMGAYATKFPGIGDTGKVVRDYWTGLFDVEVGGIRMALYSEEVEILSQECIEGYCKKQIPVNAPRNRCTVHCALIERAA